MRSLSNCTSLRRLSRNEGSAQLTLVAARRRFYALFFLGAIFEALTQIYPRWRTLVDEVSIEASPDTISGNDGKQYLAELRQLGITRINIGVQSLIGSELRKAGRARAGAELVTSAIHSARAAEIPNVSTDLIIGLPGQTDESWDSTVTELLKLKPETISTYFLTIRSNSGMQRMGIPTEANRVGWYRRYERAREMLLVAGYVQESNVRYKLPGYGGLQQKVLQFRGVPVLGIGAGARSYTNSVDYIVGGHFRPAMTQIRQYMTQVNDGRLVAEVGFRFDDEERIRKRLSLDLFDLQLSDLDKFGFAARRHLFDPILEAAVELGLLYITAFGPSKLTPRGFQYRDVLARAFFSKKVATRDSSFYFNLPPVPPDSAAWRASLISVSRTRLTAQPAA